MKQTKIEQTKIAEAMGIHPLQVVAAIHNVPIDDVIIDIIMKGVSSLKVADELLRLAKTEPVKIWLRCIMRKIISDELDEGDITEVQVLRFHCYIQHEEGCEELAQRCLEVVDQPITDELDKGCVNSIQALGYYKQTRSEAVGQRCLEVADQEIFEELDDGGVKLARAEYLNGQAKSKKASKRCLEAIEAAILAELKEGASDARAIKLHQMFQIGDVMENVVRYLAQEK